MEQSYKEKYEQALAKAKEQYNYPCMRSCMGILEEIFPELAESEDEKMMKEIIDLIMQPIWKTEKEFHRRNELCAWIKKQGQVKESHISQHENKMCEENDDSLTSDDEKVIDAIKHGLKCLGWEHVDGIKISDMNAWLENIPYTIDHEKREEFHLGYKAGLEKQDEQIDIANKEYWRGYREGKKLILDKYAEIEKQGEQKFEMKTAEESLGMDSYTFNKIVDECIFDEQKPTWSEEDEQYVEDALALIGFGLSAHTIGEVQGWLHSLKGKVQPQPKQEWSEEDKYMYDILCGTIENTDINENTKYKLISWLKSLRPRNTWKPSDEQMGCLSDAIEHYNSLGYPAPKLKELYEQLKKL